VEFHKISSYTEVEIRKTATIHLINEIIGTYHYNINPYHIHTNCLLLLLFIVFDSGSVAVVCLTVYPTVQFIRENTFFSVGLSNTILLRFTANTPKKGVERLKKNPTFFRICDVYNLIGTYFIYLLYQVGMYRSQICFRAHYLSK